MVAINVGLSRQVICASPDYLKVHGTPKTPQDLSKHHCVTFDKLASTKSWNFRSGKSDIVIPIHSRLVVTTAEAAIDAAIAGTGITRVISYQVANLPADKIITILNEYESTPVPVNLMYIGGRNLPQKVRAFLDFAKPRLKANLS
jgi:DNA-binding transcriptional LysR family regulator